ncbi:MAG: cell wall-binding repeat-containing protein, partial [bacterium]|nr:cell wall-binding repeat-containing protein [bacterium]
GTILLNDPDVLLPEVLTELERALGPGAGQTVYIAGQTAAQSAEVEQQISDAGYTPRRLGDSNRLGTAVKIADEIVDLNPGTTTKVFVAEHALFADALVAGAVAGDILNDGKADPILLNQRGASTIDPFTNTFLTAHPEITAVELIGGEVALSAGLATTLTTNFPATTLDRTAGADRFATAVALMQKHVIDPDFIVVANGQKEGLPGSGQALEPTGLAASSAASGFFDALLAGPYSAGKQAALVLTKAQELPIPTQDYISSNIPGISHVLIIGSLELVSAAVEAQIEALFD